MKLRVKPRVKISRREFLKRSGKTALVAALGGTAYGTLIEPREITLDRIRIAIAGLPDALDGFKIVQLSDIHLHPYTRIGLVEKAVSLANQLQPDLIVHTGDYIYLEQDSIDELAPVLGKMNARLGQFAVLGNHDFPQGRGKPVMDPLEKSGIRGLRNRGVEISVDGTPLYLAGVDSALKGHAKPLEALADRRAAMTTIFLAHEPDIADDIAKFPSVHLQLSGHSHGGQVKFPFLGPLILPTLGQKYPEGLYRTGDLQIYTNRGLGTIGLPIRLNCPPQISEITLVRA